MNSRTYHVLWNQDFNSPFELQRFVSTDEFQSIAAVFPLKREAVGAREMLPECIREKITIRRMILVEILSSHKKITSPPFSIRTMNCLANVGVKTIGELGEWTENELLRIKNFGRYSRDEVKEILSLHGLKLKK